MIVIGKFYKHLRNCELVVASVVFMSSLVVLSINIVLRQCFNSALTWAEEYMRYAIIWVTFVGCALCAEDDLHVGIDVFIQMSPPLGRRILRAFGMLCATFFAGYMVIFSARNTLLLFNTMQRSPVMLLPMWIVYLSMPVGMFFTTMQFGRKAYQYLTAKTADFADKPKNDDDAGNINILDLS